MAEKKDSKKKTYRKPEIGGAGSDKASLFNADEEGKGEELAEKKERAKPGPKGKAEGFRAECYKLIEKGIDRNTEMVCLRLRFRKGDGTNVLPGDTFTAHEMDARVISGAMDKYAVMPLSQKPKEGERLDHYVTRMMAIYEPGIAPRTCGK